jgi:homoserine kinase type II
VSAENLLTAWGINFNGVDDSAVIEGSPERTAARMVVRDHQGGRWILEKIESDNLSRKQQIAELLESLKDLDEVTPYQKVGNSFFQCLPAQSQVEGENENWMLRPYVEGVELNRDIYLTESWRIDAMSSFLVRLKKRAVQVDGFFSPAGYAQDRMGVWSSRYPQLASRIRRPFQTLEQSFFPICDTLPRAFCHGDFHPLNFVWGADSIRAVIDWEFCGMKPELYDAALLIGCFGFDDPDNLLGESSLHLLQNLRKSDFGAQESWTWFPDLVATIRFGWMSEWIRRGEEETAEMEAEYLAILTGQRDFIAERWFS